MRPHFRGLVPRAWLRLPRRTVRLRLAALYAALFLVSGAGLLAITYELVAHELPTKTQVSVGGSLRATLDYVVGTLAGAICAAAVGLLVPHVTALGQALALMSINSSRRC